MDDLHRPDSKDAENGSGKCILLILVGAPGRGKTTFCEQVMSCARRPWIRICQDTINNGKAGTKSQCLNRAMEALKDGKSVFIDRCNLEREQRVDFVNLVGSNVDVHAVVLDHPAQLCISRSVKRTGHEGNLQGGKAAAVVNRMLQKKELPKLSEGFSRITFCQNETDVKSTVNMYQALGPLDNLPSGCFGQKRADAKVQLGIMRFLKKVEIPDKRASGAVSSENSISKEEPEKDLSYEGPEKNSKMVTDVDENVTRNKVKNSSFGGFNVNDFHTLAFPSISTSDFQFNHEKASDIIVEKVDEFLSKVENIRLVLVDLIPESHILSLVRAKAIKKNIDFQRFFTVIGDITRLHTKAGVRCNVIANAANWRLKPGGGGVNASIFKAAGRALEIATRERAETLTPGRSIVVPLPPSCPLYDREGVTHVIHVLGPNMNPQRPNCLQGDYIKGCKILREAYSSLFESFASIVKDQPIQEERKWISGSNSHDNPVGKNPKDQCTEGEQKVEREDYFESESNKKYKRVSLEPALKDSECEYSESTSGTSKLGVQNDENAVEKAKKSWQSWAQALYQIAMYPEQHNNVVLELSDDIVVLHDLYPKAKRHLLVLSRVSGLDQLSDVQKQHVWLLKKMESVGRKWVERFLLEDASLNFRLGYHSVPSMRQLHLHVISQDFDSPNLKNKKHWNSFTTAFFRDSIDVIDEVEKFGKASLIDGERLLTMELRCHRCRTVHPNIPRLKTHISKCRAHFPGALLQNGRLVSAPSREMGNQ